jgi:hypothetical protein
MNDCQAGPLHLSSGGGDTQKFAAMGAPGLPAEDSRALLNGEVFLCDVEIGHSDAYRGEELRTTLPL